MEVTSVPQPIPDNGSGRLPSLSTDFPVGLGFPEGKTLGSALTSPMVKGSEGWTTPLSTLPPPPLPRWEPAEKGPGLKGGGWGFWAEVGV